MLGRNWGFTTRNYSESWKAKTAECHFPEKIYPGATLLPLWAWAGGGVKGVGVSMCVCVHIYIKAISLKGIAVVPIKKSANI